MIEKESRNRHEQTELERQMTSRSDPVCDQYSGRRQLLDDRETASSDLVMARVPRHANGQARHRTDDCHDDQLRDRRGRSAPQSNRTERDQSARGSRQPKEWSTSMGRGSNRDNRPDRLSYSYRSTSRSHDRHRRDSNHDWPHDSEDNNDRWRRLGQ